MNKQEAEEYAKGMSYRSAVYNALQGKCIPYRKATLMKLYELLDVIEPQKGRTENGRFNQQDGTTTQESLLQTLSILEAENERLHDALDKIADELEEMRPTIRPTDEYWQGVSYGICYVLDNAIKIIDKYRESEGV